jgi:serine/threonine protein kinase
MSPEGLIHNIYGPKTDVWAFGVLIYELLHGETPFASCKTESELKYQVSVQIKGKRMREELSSEVKQAISMCMEVDEHRRVKMGELEKVAYFCCLVGWGGGERVGEGKLEKKYLTASHKVLKQLPLNRKKELSIR